jgi:hypothetical protein
MRLSTRLGLLAATVGLGALVGMTPVQPAYAQFGISIGGFPIGIHFGGRYRGGRYGRRHGRGGGREEAEDSSPARGKSEKVTVSKGAPTSAQQMEVLHDKVVRTAMAPAAGSTKDLFEVGMTTSKEGERDYVKKIEAIIKEFTDEQKNHKNTESGDVTVSAIEQSLDRAFKSARLDVFARFAGESWTSERMRTMTLELVQVELPRLFKGNVRGLAPMSSLDALIQKAAESVYRRIFETSELLASNRSSSLFIERLYQTHGAQVDQRLRESADTMIMRGALRVIRPYETAMRRSENGYAERYRAQRIVFDCLSENVGKVSSDEVGMAANSQIEENIATMSIGRCKGWLDNAFGTDPDNLQPQAPKPMRAVWSERGAKENPSMYNSSLGTF